MVPVDDPSAGTTLVLSADAGQCCAGARCLGVPNRWISGGLELGTDIIGPYCGAPRLHQAASWPTNRRGIPDAPATTRQSH